MLDRTKLAAELLAGMKAVAENPSGLNIGSPAKCVLCRTSYIYRGSYGGDSGRLCSSRCRDAYDHAGLRYRPVKVRYTWADGTPMLQRGDGFVITCRQCGTEFTSKGVAFCSDQCARKAKQHEPDSVIHPSLRA
jgi:hypothetical protein